ncbi:hypothetical protein KJ835_01470 [Patescibacteria group bacterium]|nr:hypothetical protein [Patescibacteria group bacterium]
MGAPEKPEKQSKVSKKHAVEPQSAGQKLIDEVTKKAEERAKGENAYEAFLVYDAKEKRVDIAPETHAAILEALSDVPFGQLALWYESSDRAGSTPPDTEDYFPKQINMGEILPLIKRGGNEDEKRHYARYAVYSVVNHFVGYAGGNQALYDRRSLIVKRLGKTRETLTWRDVMLSEIKPTDVAEYEKKQAIEQVIERESKKINPKERETLNNLASDFPEFVVLNKKHPAQFTISLPSLQYYPDAKKLGSIRSRVGSTKFMISGNTAKYIGHKNEWGRENEDDEYLYPIKGDMSIYVLSGALQICKEYLEAERKGDSDTSLTMEKEFAEWIKNPTETFGERRKGKNNK